MPTIQNKSSRMLYIDGLKLIMCYMVMLIHFAISYFPEGFIGFGSVYEPAERSQAFWASLPYSLYTNSSLPLHVFFALIALLPTIAFYKSKQPYLSGHQALFPLHAPGGSCHYRHVLLVLLGNAGFQGTGPAS